MAMSEAKRGGGAAPADLASAITVSWENNPNRAYSAEDLVGKTVANRYRLESVIGRGGMGAVYQALDGETEQCVALKLILLEALMRPNLRRRFIREVKAARRIDSNNVVRLLDSGSDDELGTPFMVMERLRGVDLSAASKKLGPIAPKIVAKIGVQACRGLRAAHEQQLVHRDIKPANLFLSAGSGDELIVKICDFGIAKQSTSDEGDVDDTASLTQTGSVLGTPTYSSPEQTMNPKEADARSDIWSLCLTLYKVLTARRIWPRVETVAQLVVWICTHDIRPLLQVAPWVDPKLAQIIHRGLERRSEKRWATVAELEAALLPFAGGSGSMQITDLRRVDGAVRDAAVNSVPEPPDEQVAETLLLSETEPRDPPSHAAVERRPTIKWGAALALVAVGGAAAIFWTRSQSALGTPAIPELPRSISTATTSAAATSTANPAPTVSNIVARILVEPPRARVAVGGKLTPLDDGVLRLEGRPGDSFTVRVAVGEHFVEEVVGLLSDGSANPSRIVLNMPVAPSIATPTTKSQASSRAPSANWQLRDDWSD